MFHLLAKPSGSICNIDCKYCFFLSKEALYPDDERHRMSDATLEAYVRQLLEAHDGSGDVIVAWQGGEPTLMKLEFFERAVALVAAHKRPEQRVKHTIQTNGIALDDAWCAFFKQHEFLVGLSVDGPRDVHDAYRVDRRGHGTFDLVAKASRTLQRHGVDMNVLCCVHAANEGRGREVYRFLRDDLGARFIQFIPIVERATRDTIDIANMGWSRGEGGRKRILYTQTGDLVTDRSVGRERYGRFLIDVFEEWVRHDIGEVYVQLFDVTLEALFGRHLLCVHAPTCGQAPALEFNGDVYSCDHYVEPKHLLGNIHQTHMRELVASFAQREFGDVKQRTLTSQCRDCAVVSLCNGGCPKDRFALSRDGEPGHNYLCPGLELFFTHVRPAMQAMADLLERDRAPAELMAQISRADAASDPYRPCTCGSGKKFRFCHGARSSGMRRADRIPS